jgi:hypothetical protein
MVNITLTTKDTYAFSGYSEWRTKTITVPTEASSDLKNGMYTHHTTLATDVSTSSDMVQSLEVFPNNKGECGYYNFTFTNAATDAIDAAQEVWIWFNYLEYDFYVGESDVWYEGEVDDDGFDVYYIPCYVQIDNSEDFVPGAYCYTKRHQVRVGLNTAVPSLSKISITLVGIRNPNAETLEYTIALMDYYDGSNEDDRYWGREYFENSVVYYTYISHLFDSAPTALLDLFEVSTDNEKMRALRGESDYEFHFQVMNSATFVWHEYSYFLVHFPPEYEMLPSVGVGKKDSSYGHTFELTKMLAVWNRSAETAEELESYVISTTTFTEDTSWNATMDQLGNTLMMTIADNTQDPSEGVTTSSTVVLETSATINSVNTYFDYILTVKGVSNPDNGHLRGKTRPSDMDIEYGKSATATSYIWLKYDEYTSKFGLTLLYAKSDTAGSGSFLFTKAYGLWSSTWVGFKPSKTLLYVLNEDMEDCEGELHVIAGQQSPDFAVSTGVNLP